MKTAFGHLTYCSNIHPGESWTEHLAALKSHIPALRNELAADSLFGIGLRLSNRASLELSKQDVLTEFQHWLKQTGAYVFTMNGFPYGGFHHQRVKDEVHAPDWRSTERLHYTLRMFRILAALLPESMEGGISTSPLSYKPWFHAVDQQEQAREQATWHVVHVLEYLVQLRLQGGPRMHLDLEPEPDGLLENSREFIRWFVEDLEPLACAVLQEKLDLSKQKAADFLREHIRLCYDVCHFAIQYEHPETVFQRLAQEGIRIGKIQLSAALKIHWPADADGRRALQTSLQAFDEPVYLHQVVSRHTNGDLRAFRDLPEAWPELDLASLKEWRAHFHVPLFATGYQGLESTADVVKEVLNHHRAQPLCSELEVETYTWEVLPQALKTDLHQSITRELRWVLDQLGNPSLNQKA